MAPQNKLTGTQLIHTDDNHDGPEVAPSISVSTSQSAHLFPIPSTALTRFVYPDLDSVQVA